MELALCGMSALRALRQLRASGLSFATLQRIALSEPVPSPNGRWSQKSIREHLAQQGLELPFSRSAPLNVAVPHERLRLRVKGTKSTIFAKGLPEASFVRAGNVLLSSPELLFLEMGRFMAPEVQLLFGMELCGSFTRDAANPRNAQATFFVPAATSTQRIRSFLDSCHGVEGIKQAREVLAYVVDNAWSPMEAVVAALATLPLEMLGYGLAPITLNERVETKGAGEKETRVPDLLVQGTSAGLNYDGVGHQDLKGVVDAALNLATHPGEESSAKELEGALAAARIGVLGDKRRDRDLSARGYTVLPVTKEDLYELGGLDRVMRQLIAIVEREGNRDLSRQRTALESRVIASLRQHFIWSLLPGNGAKEAREKLDRWLAPNEHPTLVTGELRDGALSQIEVRVL